MYNIDVTMCISSEEEEQLSGLILSQLAAEPVNVHVIHYGFSSPLEARIHSFDVGGAEYFTYVDPDDEIIPGVFTKIANIIKDADSPPFVGVNEVSRKGRIHQAGEGLEGNKWLPINAFHHLPTYRRDLYSHALWGGIPALAGAELAIASRFVSSQQSFCYLQELGYVWARREGSYSRAHMRSVDMQKYNNQLVNSEVPYALYTSSCFGQDGSVVAPPLRCVLGSAT